MPLKKMRVMDKDIPYMISERKEAIRARRKAAKCCRKTNDPADWDWMKKLRNEATRLRRKAIREYWNSKAEDLKDKK